MGAKTVPTGAVVAAAGWRDPVERAVVDGAPPDRMSHCDGKVADSIGDCRLMGRISSSKLDCGKEI